MKWVIDDWKFVLRRAWSIRLILIAALFSAAEAGLALVDADVLGLSRGQFAALVSLVCSGAAVSRFIPQRRPDPAPPRQSFWTDENGALRRGARKAGGWLAVCVTLTAGAEGLRTAAYLDPVGIPTICFGETLRVKMGDTATVAECKAMLGKRLAQFDAELTRCLPALPTYPDERRAALVSWTYNVGSGAACASTLVRKARAGDMRGACDELLKWDKATKAGVRIRLPGLTTRRAEERALCLQGAPA